MPVSAVAAIESDLGRLESEWAELAERSDASPFHHPGWVCAWSSAFGQNGLSVLTLRNSEKLTAALPLCTARGRLSSPTNWHTPVFGPVSDSPESARRLFDALFTLDTRSIDLSLLESNDGTLGLAEQSAEEAGRLVATRPLTRSPWIALEGSWEDYEGSISKNRRKGLRRTRRRLEELGEITMDVERGGPSLDDSLEHAFRIEASGWKGDRRTAIASRPETKHFYTEVARWAAERGWLMLAFLRLDGHPIAFDLTLERGSARYSLKTGYDASLARYGPGAVLFYDLLRNAYETGLGRFELMGEEDEFKLGWTDRVSQRCWLHASAPTPTGRAEATIIRARERIRPTARRLKQWMRAR